MLGQVVLQASLAAGTPWVKMPLLTPEAAAAGISPGGEGGQWPRGPVTVSRGNPDFLLLPIDVGGVYRSLDGGRHWNLAMAGWNARGANGFAIDPGNPDQVLGIGGNSMDWDAAWSRNSPNGLYRSTDRAGTWKQVMSFCPGTGGALAFDPTSYDSAKRGCTTAYFASCALGLFRSDDGGTNWQAVSWGTPRRTRISQDGGATWAFAKDAAGRDCEWKGADVSFSDPKNRDLLFASQWRSTDKGATWTPMDHCDGVFNLSPDGHLIGRKDKSLVTSTDGGATWRTLVEVAGGFTDVACDERRGRYYLASENRLKQWDNGALTTLETPRDQYGNISVSTVAVDAQAPDIIYVGGAKNIYASHATVCRSTDAGATWENLTTGDGPHEVSWIRVHPVTREAWMNGQCYGNWRIAALAKSAAAPLESRHARPAPALALVAALPPPATGTAQTAILGHWPCVGSDGVTIKPFTLTSGKSQNASCF